MALSFLVPLAYYSMLHCRDYRYMIVFLPFTAMCTGCLLGYAVRALKAKLVYSLIVVVLLASAFSAVSYYRLTEPKPDPVGQRYYSFPVSMPKEVWSSNPSVSAYTDAQVFLLYYPVYESKSIKSLRYYLSNNTYRIGYVFLDTCGGGIICHPLDKGCPTESEKLFALLEEKLVLVFNETSGSCRYYIFKSV